MVGTRSYTPEENWDSTATQMVKRFKESGHPVFKSISALSRGLLKRKNDTDTTHVTVDASNSELLYQTVHSANQLCIYGAVACWCEEFGLKLDETSERITKTDTEQILKEVRQHEVISLVQTPRNDEQELQDTGERNPIYKSL